MMRTLHLNFNSIKVQLELNFFELIIYHLFVFQFHKGTIRTTICNCKIRHYRHFNSIKVQLEQFVPKTITLLYLYFNSIKVQLEQPSRSRKRRARKFQFHKGTIRTSPSSPSALCVPYFNSIKVQLEQGIRRGSVIVCIISIP